MLVAAKSIKEKGAKKVYIASHFVPREIISKLKRLLMR